MLLRKWGSQKIHWPVILPSTPLYDTQQLLPSDRRRVHKRQVALYPSFQAVAPETPQEPVSTEPTNFRQNLQSPQKSHPMKVRSDQNSFDLVSRFQTPHPVAVDLPQKIKPSVHLRRYLFPRIQQANFVLRHQVAKDVQIWTTE